MGKTGMEYRGKRKERVEKKGQRKKVDEGREGKEGTSAGL